MRVRKAFPRIPKHIGFIPDGNRRWAKARGLSAGEGYAAGVSPGICLLEECKKLGVQEVSIYGFTQENTHRPKDQTEAYRAACVDFAQGALERGVALLALGDTASPLFPRELLPYASRLAGQCNMAVNLLVNYNWNWDIQTALHTITLKEAADTGSVLSKLASAQVSRIDLIVRWGGRRRLSGFLPLQSAYADIYVNDAYWPDYETNHLHDALRWYEKQDITLGG